MTADDPAFRIDVEFPPGWFDRVDRLMAKLRRVPRRKRKALRAKLDRLMSEPRIVTMNGSKREALR